MKKRRALLFIFLIGWQIISVGQSMEIDSLSTALEKDVSGSREIDIINELAFHYIHVNPIAARDDVDIALRKGMQLQYTQGIARSYNVLGAIKWSRGDYTTALEDYLTAARHFEALDDDMGISIVYNNIGEIYKKRHELDKALEYLSKSLAIQERLVGKGKAYMSYTNIAEVYVLTHQYDLAEQYYYKVTASDARPSMKQMAYALTGLGDIMVTREQFDKAAGYYNSALKLRKSTNDLRGQAAIYLKKGHLLKEIKKYDSAEISYARAVKVARKIDARDIVLEMLRFKTSLDSVQGDLKSAFITYWNYTMLKDSLFNENKATRIAEMQTLYETELLKKENEANLAKVKQHTILNIAIVVILLFVLVLALIFFRQRQVQRRANELLTQKNNEIESQNHEIQLQAEKLVELNRHLERLNENLEEKVKLRTNLLRRQNDILSQYAFTNAHELRAPVANILGLINLLEKTELSEKENEIVLHLRKSTDQLDEVIKDIRERLENSSTKVLAV